MSKTTQKTPLQNLLITTSENAAGFSVSGITGYAPELVRRVANALVKSGDLVRAKLGARSVRYFANDDLARAYQAGQAPARRGATAVLHECAIDDDVMYRFTSGEVIDDRTATLSIRTEAIRLGRQRA